MAGWFIDTPGSGNDNGSPENPWLSIKTGFEYGSLASGDIVIMSRRSTFDSALENIDPSGTFNLSWLQVVAWPRAELFFNATFTNGSTVVTINSGITPNLYQHVGRKIKNNADGKWYTIFAVISGDFIIDREYAGTTAVNAICTIEKDEHYDYCQGLDDSSWPIGRKKTDWNNDPDNLPIIDFEDTEYNLYLTLNYMWRFIGINFRNGAGDYGSVRIRNNANLGFKYCLFEQSQNRNVMNFNATELRAMFNQCIFKGSESGSSQIGLTSSGGGSRILMKDCAVYGFGGYGINCPAAVMYLNNVNIGVEIANGNADYVMGSFDHYWKDVKLGGTNGTIINGIYYRSMIFSENHNKILGDHRQFHNNGYNYSKTVVAGSGDPYKRTGGSDKILVVEENEGSGSAGYLFDEMMHMPFGPDGLQLCEDTSIHNYRFYINADSMSAVAAQVKLKIEYIDAYNNSSEYHWGVLYSDESISVRTGVDDWSQIIEVTGVQPAVQVPGNVNVIIHLLIGFYDADGKLNIDLVIE